MVRVSPGIAPISGIQVLAVLCPRVHFRAVFIENKTIVTTLHFWVWSGSRRALQVVIYMQQLWQPLILLFMAWISTTSNCVIHMVIMVISDVSQCLWQKNSAKTGPRALGAVIDEQ